MRSTLPDREQRGLRLSRIGIVLPLVFVVAIFGAGSVFMCLWGLLGAPGVKPEGRLCSEAFFDLVRVSLGAVVGAAVLLALVVVHRRQKLDEDSARRDGRRLHDERFDAAVTKLGHAAPAVRLGGGHALAGLADEASSRDLRQTCIDVLCAYLRLPYVAWGDLPEDDPLARRQYFALQEVRHTVIRLIRDHLRLPSEHPHSWHGHNFDFTCVHLDGGQFDGARFDGSTVDFTGSVFTSGIVVFDGAVFTGGTVIFDSMNFEPGIVRFDGGTVTFKDSLFEGGTVTFTGAAFNSGTVAFDGSVFTDGEVGFDGAVFDGATVSFEEAEFDGGTVTFDEAALDSSTLTFNRAAFKSDLVAFDGSVVNGGTLTFDGAVFDGGFLFLNGVVFNGGTVTFDSPNFVNGALFFDAAVFNGGTVAFNSPVFDDAFLSDGNITFNLAALDGIPGASLRFEDAVFGAGTVTFNGGMLPTSPS